MIRQRGFTLLEVIVALGILAFVILATHQILERTLTAKETSEAVIQSWIPCKRPFVLWTKTLTK